MEPDTQSYRPELRNPVFWESEGWKEELGLCVCVCVCDQYVGPWGRPLLMTLKEWRCFVKVLGRVCVLVCV